MSSGKSSAVERHGLNVYRKDDRKQKLVYHQNTDVTGGDLERDGSTERGSVHDKKEGAENRVLWDTAETGMEERE